MEYSTKRENLALRGLKVLLVITVLVLLGSLYLLFAPFHGPESSFDMWSPLANVIEGNYQESNVLNNLTEDYYYFSLGFRPLPEIKSSINTPEEAIKFRDANFQYISDEDLHGQIEYVSSFEEFYESEWNGDCEDFAIALAGLLSDDGYAPMTLSIEKKSTSQEKEEYNLNATLNSEVLGHRIYIYQENGKYGSIGTGHKDDREAVFESLEELVASFNEGVSSDYAYRIPARNSLRNLNIEFPNNVWIDGKGNIKN